MRKYFVLLAIVAQVSVLAYMAIKHEVILATGDPIYLRTAPIDPRDPFRGDFVRLSYPFNTVYAKRTRGTVKDHVGDKGYQVYAVMKPTENDLYTLDYLTDQRPTEPLYIKGRITNRHWSRGQGAANVKYGVEQLYVEQGSGREIERTRGTRSGIQIPMEVQVAIGDDGTAVLRDYRWSKLAIQLEILRFNRQNRRNNSSDQNPAPVELSPKLRITLKNVSDSALVISDPDDHCGFKLVPVAWASKTYAPLDTSCEQIASSSRSTMTLVPQQAYQAELDLSKPRWHMRIKNKDDITSEGEIGMDNNSDMFRIIYQSPRPEQLPSSASTSQAIWQGQLPSRAFNARGRID